MRSRISDVSRHVVALLGLCALTFFAGLGRPAISDSDEAFYAESAREMIESGDWLTPYYNDAARFEKPVLYYWLAAASYTVAGVSAAAARFPSALAGLGLVMLAYACARRWYDGGTAFLAGVVTATSFGYVTMAHQALPDLALAFCVTLATWSALVAVLADRPGGAPRPPARRWIVLAAVGAAGAVLIKGPVGLALPAAIVIPVVGWEHWRDRSRLRLGLADLGAAALVFLGLAAPWYGAMAIEHGPAYLELFFIGENVTRFTTARYNDPRPIWYYLPIAVGGLLPWSPFMVLWWPGLRTAWRERRMPAIELRLAIWALAPLAFYTLSVGKQPRYILPMLPPLAILLARGIRRALAEPSGQAQLFGASATAAGVVIAALGVLVYAARALLVEWDGAWTLVVAGAVLLSGMALVIAALSSLVGGSPGAPPRRAWVPALTAAAAVVAALGAHYVVLASPGLAPVERMATMVEEARAGGEAYGRYRAFNRNLVFYTETPHVELPVLDAARDFLRSSERVLCVLPGADAARLEREGLRLIQLGEIRYLNIGSLTLRTLLDPDPERYLHHVVLVTNR